jgi:1,2-diacylglycerol 3-alpha-glucosyltransferase
MGESLKIVFFTDTYAPSVDGVVTSIINTKTELERRGHKVYIFTSGNIGVKPIAEISKNVFAIHGIKFPKYPQYRIALFTLPLSTKFNSIKPDIVHIHTPFTMGISGLAMAKINKLPTVSTFHTFFTSKKVMKEYGMSSKMGQKIMSKYSWPYARFFFNKCDAVIAPTNAANAVLRRNGIKNLIVVPNGVDTKRFRPKRPSLKLKKALQQKPKDKIVLYVGRLSKEKRLDVLIKTAEKLKNSNITFVIGGTGPHQQALRKMVYSKNLHNVKFVGFINDKDLPDYYSAADIFCTPSTFETQGITVLEALASGKPVVAARYSTMEEIIKPGKNGELFKAGNHILCAYKIEKVINNLDSYNYSVDSIKNYSANATTDTLLNVYREVIANRS